MRPKIVVLMGGRSLERDVSIKSGKRIAAALTNRGYEVMQLDLDEGLVPRLVESRPDLVYIALHGKDGEDGTIQELLEILGIPYTGPGPFPSAIGFNKVLSKELFRANGIPTPAYCTMSANAIENMGAAATLPFVWERLGGKALVVKPAAQGSALGVTVVRDYDSLAPAVLTALGYEEQVVIEEYVSGTEIAIGVLGVEDPKTLPPVEVVPLSGFYDFEARYTAGKTDYFVPARLPEKAASEAARLALAVHNLLGCKELSRVDMIVDEQQVPQVLELNISPGMTETSLLPLAASAAGLSFEDLVEYLVNLALGLSPGA